MTVKLNPAGLAAWRTLLHWLLACLNFTLDSEWFILLGQRKKMISMSYSSTKSCWKPWRWVKFDLILMMRDIYINSNLNPLTNFTSSRLEALNIKISSCGHLSNENEDHPSQHENSYKLCSEIGHLVFEFIGKPMETESQSGIRVQKLTNWVKSFEIQKL